MRTTSKWELERLAPSSPAVRALLRYRKAAKALQAFGEVLPRHIHSRTGRLHPRYTQLRTQTGRLSCSSPNIQQLPRDARFRSCIVASPGHALVLADYSQIELRVAAEISGDERMIAAYRDGRDLHRITAALLVGKSEEDVTREERQMAKAVNFGLIFGMGGEGLKRYAETTYHVAMTLEEAQNFRRRFLDAYPGIASWHRREAQSDAPEVRTLGGRVRHLAVDERLSGRLNTPVQGTAADILKCALGLLPSTLQDTGAHIVACVHDEILLEAPDEGAAYVAALLSRTMERAGRRFLSRVPVVAEARVGRNWAEK